MNRTFFRRWLSPPGSRRSRAGLGGFTVVELMVTIAVAAVLLALAAPAMQNFMTGRAVAAEAQELVAALHFARSEAMKRSAPVTICRTTAAAPTTCAAAGADWQYWIVFAEHVTAGNTIGTADADELVLRQQSVPGSGKTVFDSAAPIQYVSFQANGIALSSPALPFNWTIHPTIDVNWPVYLRYTRKVCLNTQGRADVVDGNSSCST
jgi:type IV fimbrial biogenesis protein FimT